jgi:hypothetical protein
VVTPRLQHNADPGAPSLIGTRGIGAQHRHLARRSHPESLQDLDGGGLARTVRAQQDQHLTPAREVTPVRTSVAP